MELKNGPVSFFSLIGGALQAANRAFGSVLLLLVGLALLEILLAAIIVGAGFVFKFQTNALIQIFAAVLNGFLGIVFSTAVIQLLASKIEKTPMSATEAFTSSVVPSLYFLVSSLILCVCAGLVFFAAAATHSLWVIIITYAALCFIFLPFLFTQYALALREETPLGALRYSWQLGSAYYIRILLTLLLLAALIICCLLAVFCAVKAIAPEYLNPMMLQIQLLMWSQQFSLPVLIGAAIILLLFYLFVLLTFQAIITILFLNLDYCQRVTQSRELETAVPQPEQIPAAQAAQTAMPLDVSVKQASIRTQSDEDTQRHLDQVYRAQEHLAQALEQEEDRMPTILFDEDMARQLAENEQKMKAHQQQTSQKKDDDQQPIKISEKPL